MSKPHLSVVVIARNEEAFIGRAFESVFEATRGWEAEVIFVDSASTDRTAEVAQGFPLRLVQLRPEWPLSPAAGRHVGLQVVSGDYVFFLDGDTELLPGFLEAAIPLMEANPGVAAALGKRREVAGGEAGIERVVDDDAYAISQPRQWRPGDRIGGSGLYRARALREVGGYNPWICSYEEAELCQRLYGAGHQVLFIPQPMISHLDHQPPSVGELRRRWRENLLLGHGQVLRLHPFRIRLYGGTARNLAMLGCFASLPPLALAALALGRPWLMLLWPAAMGALYLAFALKAASFTKPLFYGLVWTLGGVKLAQGFLRRPRDPADYPLPDGLAHPVIRHPLQGAPDERLADNNRLLEG